MSRHTVIIGQDKGNILTRAYHYIKPEAFHWMSVQVKNLITQQVFDYDAYHQDFDNGKYVLLFIDEDGSRKGTMELELNDNSGSEVYIVYKWSEFIQFLSKDKVSKSRFNEIANRLMTPRGYQGY